MNAEEQKPRARGTSVQSVERAIDILLALSEKPMSLTEVSRRVKLSKSTTARLLSSLGYRSLVVRDPVNNHYCLGPASISIGEGVLASNAAFRSLAHQSIERLWNDSGETVCVHARVGTQRVCIEEFASHEAIRYVAGLGSAVPVHIGSAGRVLLAFARPDELTALLKNAQYERVTAQSVLSESDLRESIDQVREQGFALSEGERIDGASAVSVPMQGPDGFLVALSVLGPSARMSIERRMELIPAMREVVVEIEDALRVRR